MKYTEIEVGGVYYHPLYGEVEVTAKRTGRNIPIETVTANGNGDWLKSKIDIYPEALQKLPHTSVVYNRRRLPIGEVKEGDEVKCSVYGKGVVVSFYERDMMDVKFKDHTQLYHKDGRMCGSTLFTLYKTNYPLH